jgi:hypothetical protein
MSKGKEKTIYMSNFEATMNTDMEVIMLNKVDV